MNISAALEWGNLGEVMAEMGSFLRYKDSKTTLYTPASFVLSLLGATALLFVSTVYYLGVMHTIFAHTDDDTKRFLFTDKSTTTHKGENGNIEHSTNHNNEIFQNTSDQTSVWRHSCCSNIYSRSAWIRFQCELIILNMFFRGLVICILLNTTYKVMYCLIICIIVDYHVMSIE